MRAQVRVRACTNKFFTEQGMLVSLGPIFYCVPNEQNVCCRCGYKALTHCAKLSKFSRLNDKQDFIFNSWRSFTDAQHRADRLAELYLVIGSEIQRCANEPLLVWKLALQQEESLRLYRDCFRNHSLLQLQNARALSRFTSLLATMS